MKKLLLLLNRVISEMFSEGKSGMQMLLVGLVLALLLPKMGIAQDTLEIPWLQDIATVHAMQESILEEGKLYYLTTAPYADFPAIKMMYFPHNQLTQITWAPTPRKDDRDYEREFIELAKQHKKRFGEPMMPYEGRQVYYWYDTPTAIYLGFGDQWSLRYSYQQER